MQTVFLHEFLHKRSFTEGVNPITFLDTRERTPSVFIYERVSEYQKLLQAQEAEVYHTISFNIGVRVRVRVMVRVRTPSRADTLIV